MANDTLLNDKPIPRLIVDNVVNHSGFERLYHGLNPTRLETLSDGVFSIVLTLLVFQLKVPEMPVVMSQPFLLTLQQLSPNLASYAVSFLALGKLWIAHHIIFHHVYSVDRPLLWLNIVFMFFLSLIPFSASFIGQYPGYSPAALLYGLNLMTASVMIFSIWQYCIKKQFIISKEIDPNVIPMANIQILKGAVIYAVGALFAFWNPYVSIGIYALVPVLYVLPAKLDRYWQLK